MEAQVQVQIEEECRPIWAEVVHLQTCSKGEECLQTWVEEVQDQDQAAQVVHHKIVLLKVVLVVQEAHHQIVLQMLLKVHLQTKAQAPAICLEATTH